MSLIKNYKFLSKIERRQGQQSEHVPTPVGRIFIDYPLIINIHQCKVRVEKFVIFILY